jgi:hypothetical protein
MLNIGAAVAKGGEGPNMDAMLSFLISAGIMAFGVWIVGAPSLLDRQRLGRSRG